MYCLSCTVYIYIPRASVLTKKESIICVQYCLFSLIKASKPMEVFGQDNIYIYVYTYDSRFSWCCCCWNNHHCLGEVCWINIAFFLGKAFEAVASWTLAVLMALIIIPLGLPAAIIVSWSSWAGASSSAKWWHSQLAKGQLEEDEDDDDVDVLMLYWWCTDDKGYNNVTWGNLLLHTCFVLNRYCFHWIPRE